MNNRKSEVMQPLQRIFAVWFLMSLVLDSQAAPTARISNLSVPWLGGGIGDIHAVTPDQRFGLSFTTGASTYRLDSAVLEHIDYPGSLQSFEVEVYRVDGYGPFGTLQTSLVGLLGNSVIDPRPTQWPGSTTYVRYSSASPLLLSPGTSYLIAAVEPANGLNETGILFASIGSGYSISGDWTTSLGNQFFSDSTSPWFASVSWGELKIEINAALVPEPTTASLLALGAICLLRGSKGKREN
jgi:hypothetical protein